MQAIALKLMHLVENVGRPTANYFLTAQELLSFTAMSVRAFFHAPPRARHLIRQITAAQIFFTGWGAMPVLCVLALAAGGIIILNTTDQSTVLGSGGVTGRVLYLVIVRELGPLIVSLVVIARSGTAVASELGGMKANKEIDGLEMMGIDPLALLVLPRLVGGVISIACLAFFFDVIAILGGFVMTRLLHELSFMSFMNSILTMVTPGDLFLIGFKNVMNGFLVFAICCRAGLSVKHSLHEVPQVTTKAVVTSISAVTLFNLLVAAGWFLVELVNGGAL